MIQSSDVKEQKQAAREPGDGALTKALAVLDRVALAETPVRFVSLLAETPYPKATLHRLLRRLTKERMLDYDPVSQKYRRRAARHSLGLRRLEQFRFGRGRPPGSGSNCG